MPRVTVIHRYFWPDTPPYASILREIAGRWIADGHRVDVLTAQPSYGTTSTERRPRVERLGPLRVERLPAAAGGGGLHQLLNLLGFPLVVAARLLTRRGPDVIMCSTAPQVTLGWVVARVARWKKASFIYHCMDIHPEIGRLSGEFANPLVYRVLSAMDLATMRRATRIVVLSEDMERAVVDRDPALANKVVTINNFSLPDDGADRVSPLPRTDDSLRVVFTGNLGRFQGLEHVITALSLLPDDVRVQMVFMGEGRARARLEQAAAAITSDHVNITFLPQGPASAAKALIADADLGLVSLVPEVARFAYPSKTATYAVEGLPLLVVCEQDTELARTVREHGLGWSVEPGDAQGLADAISQAAATSGQGCADKRVAVARYAEAEFAQDPALTAWSAMLARVVDERKESA